MKIFRQIIIIFFGFLQANPVMTEIFFQPASGTTAPQYIEFFNNKNTEIDISNWILSTYSYESDEPREIIRQRLAQESNFITINTFTDQGDYNGVYDTNEPIYIKPYSYFIISSSYCTPLNECQSSSNFYTNDNIAYNDSSDIIMSYLYFPSNEKGKILLSNSNDDPVAEVIYDVSWDIIRGKSLRLHTDRINEADNNSSEHWSSSPETDISLWLYNYNLQPQNFGSPKEENSFKLNSISYSGTTLTSNIHIVEGDVEDGFGRINNYSDSLRFSWEASNIPSDDSGLYSLDSIKYEILIEKNNVEIDNDSLQTDTLFLEISPYTLKIDSLGKDRELASYNMTVELTKTFKLNGVTFHDTIYSDMLEFEIDAYTFGQYGCVDNGLCIADSSLIDNNLDFCPASDEPDDFFISKFPFGCVPGDNSGNDCISAINYNKNANINSDNCHYVSLSTPDFIKGNKSTKVQCPIYLKNDSLSQIDSISFSLELNDFSSFSIDTTSEGSCSMALSNPVHLDGYFIDKKCFKNDNQIEIILDFNTGSDYGNLQGIINYIEFNLPDENMSTHFELDNILINDHIYNNNIPSRSKITNVISLDDSYEIWGNVLYYSGETPYEIPDVNIILEKLFDGNNVLNTINTTTNTFGYFIFNSLTQGNYDMSFEKNFIDECNGDYITGLDISRIAKKARGLISFNFDQVIAGDISLDGSISTLDASLLAQYDVGLIDNFNNNNLHWIFRPAIDPSDSTYDDLYANVIKTNSQYIIEYNPLLFDDNNRKIYGYRLGDVTGNYCSDNATRNNIDDFTFLKKSIDYKSIITLPIRLLEEAPVEGLDIKIQYDSEIFEPIAFNFININDDDYNSMSNITYNDQGISAVLWSIDDPQILYGNVAEITFKWKDKSRGGNIILSDFIVNDNNINAGIGIDYENLEESFTELHIYNNLPAKYILKQNYPNPFNPETAIIWSMPESGNISVDIYNIHGDHIESIYRGYKDAGNYEYLWNGSLHSSGIYFCRLSMENLVLQNKMILLK